MPAWTWIDMKTMVSENLSYDGESVFAIDATTLGTFDNTTCKRLQSYFSMAVQALHEFYLPEATVASVANSRTLSLVDSTSRKLFQVDAVYSATRSAWLTKIPFADIDLYSATQFQTDTSQPLYWSQVRDSELIFSTACSSIQSYKVRGWADHPTLTANATAISLSEEAVSIATTFMAAQISEKSVSDAVGMARLQIYHQKSYDQMLRYAARQNKRLFN